MRRRHSHRSKGASGSGFGAARSSPENASSRQPSRREKGLAFGAPTSLRTSALSSSRLVKRSPASGASAHASHRSTAFSADALSPGFRTRAGTAAQPQRSAVSRWAPLAFTGPDLRPRSVAAAQLSGTMVSGTPPAARSAWTCAAIQGRVRMSGKRSAYAHDGQGSDATERCAGDLRPVAGSKADAAIPAQSTGIVLPGPCAMRATRSWARAHSPTFPQKPGQPYGPLPPGLQSVWRAHCSASAIFGTLASWPQTRA